MLAEISAGLNSLKAAKDIVQGLSAAKTEAAINEVKIQLQGLILEANQGLFAAQEVQSEAAQRIADLEQEIERLNDWEAQKEWYALDDTGQGSLAYRFTGMDDTGDPEHWICPQCYEDGKKSILKHETLPVGAAETRVCHRCGFDVVTQGVRHDQARPRGAAFPRRR